MAISVFDLFSIGIGPSSSHTVGPMRAARTFAAGLDADGLLGDVVRVRAELFGSLGATGHGHGSDRAVILGLEGADPESVDTSTVAPRVAAVRDSGRIALLGKHDATLVDDDLVLHRRSSLPFHPNGMRFFGYDAAGACVRERTYYSVGGGFVVDEAAAGADRITQDTTVLPFPFVTGAQLLGHCAETGLPVSAVMLADEQAWRGEAEIRARLLAIWAVMQE
ncbi:MAG: serine dehydratase beta chain, partial [Jatrophihabitantaceae bacterium]